MLNLAVKKQPITNTFTFRVKAEASEIVSDEEARNLGLLENYDGTRIAVTSDWEVWIEPLNYVLRVNGKNNYFSNFTSLLERLREHRIKYWLSEEKWVRVETALEKANEDMLEAYNRMQSVLDYLSSKYGIIQTNPED